MAISIGNIANSGVLAGASSATFALNNNKEDVIVLVAIRDEETAGTATATYAGDAMTADKMHLLEDNNSSDDLRTYIFRKTGATTGSNNVVVSFSEAMAHVGIFAVAVAGLDATGQPDATGSGGETYSSATTIDNTITTVETTTLLFDVVYSKADGTFTVGSGRTSIGALSVNGGGDRAIASYRAVTAQGTYTMDWSGGEGGVGADDYSQAIVAYSAPTNTAPTVALGTPADTGTVTDTTPDLTFTGTDAQSDTVRYNIQIDTANTFDSGYGTEVTDNQQTSTGSSFGFGEWTGKRYRGQVFTCGTTGVITTIGFSRNKGSKDIKVYIDTVTAGNLPEHAIGSELYSFTIANANVIDEYGEYDLPTPLAVTSGTKYCFYLAPFTGGSYSNDYQDVRGINSVSGGVIQIGNDNGTWGTENLTFHYKVYVTPVGALIDKVSGTDAGFSGSPDNTDPFASGQAVTYTVQSALTDTETYYWRVRGIDPTGSNTYGAWATTRSFTVSAATAYTITKSLKYCTKVTPTAVTKSLKYAVKTTPTTLTKALVYRVKYSQTAMTKTVKYTVIKAVTVTKSLKYAVVSPNAAVQKSLKYCVVTPQTAVTKALVYKIVKATTVTKSLTYKIVKATTITKSDKYTVIKSISTTKQLRYFVISPSSPIQKSLKYTVLKPNTVTKGLIYSVIKTYAITKSLTYSVYAVTTDTYTITKALVYKVRLPITIQKALIYKTKAPVTVQKTLRYMVVTPNAAVQKSLTYSVIKSYSVTKSVRYTVIKATTIQKSLTYDIVSPLQTHLITKRIKYTVAGQKPKIIYVDGKPAFHVSGTHYTLV